MKTIKLILGTLFTPIHYLTFGLLLVVFHPIQWLALHIGGYKAHRNTVVILNGLVTYSLLWVGTLCRFHKGRDLPKNRPLIIVSNHQSLYDIPAFYWFLREYHIKFVSKIELAKGIPSISYNLRHGGNALIDRSDPRQALPVLKEFAENVNANNYAAVIFPEGTRSKDGHLKSFSPRGLQMMLKYAPNALILPVTINNSWKLLRFGKFPLSFGEQPTWTVHPAIDPTTLPFDKLLQNLELTISKSLIN